MQAEHQAERAARPDAGAVLSIKGGRPSARCGATEEQQITAQVGADGKCVAQVYVEARRCAHVDTVCARLVGADGVRLEPSERGVASAQGEVRLETPERDVHARFSAQGPQLPIRKIAEAKTRAERERQ